MALVAGPTDMIGSSKDGQFVNSLPLPAFLLGKFFGKLLDLALHLLLEFFQLCFLLPDFLKILLQTQPIIVYWSLRFRAQR